MSTIAGAWDLKKTLLTGAESALRDDDDESLFTDEPDRRVLVSSKDFQKGGQYRSIVKLFMHYEGQAANDDRYAMGTGWLIRPDLLVTAGHCAFDWSQNQGKGFGRAVEVKAYIGYNGKKSINTGDVQFRHGIKIVTTQGWLKSGMNRQNDVSFIKLESPFTEVTPFQWQDTPMSGNEMIGVVGYPGDKEQDGEQGAQMYQEFKQTKYDRATSANNMLEYRINTYKGQSGSPVIRQGQSVSIGAHVYGGAGNNSASPIGPLGNPYAQYISAFDGTFKQVSPTNAAANVTYLDLTPAGEADFGDPVEDFWQTMKSVLSVGTPLISGALQAASPFMGPIGGPIAALAGTAIGAVGKQLGGSSESDFVQKDKQPGVAHQAILNEALVEAYFFGSKVHNKANRQALNKQIMEEYQKQAAEAELVGPKVLPSLMSTVLPLAQDVVLDTQNKAESSFVPTKKTSIPRPTNYSQLDDFSKRIVDAPTTETVDESLWDSIGSVLSAATTGVNIVQKGLSVVNQLIPPAESAFEETPLDGHLTVLSKRALLGSATAAVLRKAPVRQLEEEGLFSAIKSAALKIAPAVIKYTPVVIDALRPVVNALTKPEGESDFTSDPGSDSGESLYEEFYGGATTKASNFAPANAPTGIYSNGNGLTASKTVTTKPVSLGAAAPAAKPETRDLTPLHPAHDGNHDGLLWGPP